MSPKLKKLRKTTVRKAGERVFTELFRYRFNAVCAIVLLVLLGVYYVVASFHYPPYRRFGNILCDYRPLLETADGLAVDSDGNFYLHCQKVTVCYDANWQYACAYANRTKGQMYIRDDILYFSARKRGGRVREYTLNGDSLGTFPKTREGETLRRVASPDGGVYTFHRVGYMEYVRASDGTVVFSRCSLGSLLRLLIFLTVFASAVRTLAGLVRRPRRDPNITIE